MSLSDVACRNSKPKEKPYKLTDSLGLYLLVNPTGSKLWRMKYRYFGKERTLSIGPYPLITLQEARDERDKARKLLAAHQDPSLAKQEVKRLAAESASNTFESVARDWHERYKVRWSEKHAQTVMRRLEIDLFPTIGKIPVKDITTPRITAVIEAIEKRGAYEMARRCLQYARAIFSYAKIKGKVEHNPADIKAKDFLTNPEQGHFAAMEAKDLPAFLERLHRNDGRLNIQTKIAMELLLLTFVRTGELRMARWEEIDFEKAQWVIPGERMKMGRDHIVPLSTQAIELFKEMQGMNGHREWIFTNQRDPRKPMSDGAILMALNRMGYRGIHTGHGFRALAMTTIMEELGYRYEIPDIQLAHAKGDDIRRAYDRTKFLPERIKMMQEWADYIDAQALR
ncbi:MAG: integrase arm-type DNA-binding domain-containing protein [Pseudobdellovibrionaceae bacterium]|jgi:integrase|nr:integrase arm-type DNA-binding domain-containing protein [Pseudobdellovibrionaceae bacterium]